MVRALLIALSGIVYFILALLIFLPFRMKPIKNYNLVALPLLTAVFLYLFYTACTIEKVSTGYLLAYFAGILMWQVVGEIPSIRVPSGVILRFSDLNIKLLGGYFYVLAGWVLLYILWITGSIKNQAAFTFMIFLGIWTFEVYMDNYTARVPLNMMPRIANVIMSAALIASAVVLYMAKNAATLEQNTVMGGLLYLTLSVVIMAAGQWKKPQGFYLKYEPAVIAHDMKLKKEELEHINSLKRQLNMAEEEKPQE
ncbi:MAG: hypothetical protein WCQ99_07915 [Pseudomonadota bacterium]